LQTKQAGKLTMGNELGIMSPKFGLQQANSQNYISDIM